MHPSLVDAENEFEELEMEVGHLEAALAGMTPIEELDAQQAWAATHIYGSATEKIYSGFERVMAMLASAIDRAPVTHREGWHAALLKRMAHPFPGVRDAILSKETAAQLDRLRAFRHRERNSYVSGLDLHIVVDRARDTVHGFSLLRADVRRFFDAFGNDHNPASNPTTPGR